MRVDRLRGAYDVDTELVHFPLHPDTPVEGREMAGLYAARGLDPDRMYRDMKARMDAEGLPYGRRTHTYNSRLAQELGKWADTVTGGEALHGALYRAYFVDARNIGDAGVLLDVVERAGLPPSEARSVIADRSYSDAVDADWERSRLTGVTGVPTYESGGAFVVGAQPYETLERLVRHAGAGART